jgi:uncharacterized protein YrrD
MLTDSWITQPHGKGDLKMEFKQGAEVVSSEGETIGALRRVMLDPRTKKVAFLVVERGFFFSEDKVVPLDFVEKVTEDRVLLHESKQNLKELNTFEETHFVPLDPEGENVVQAYYWYPPLSGANMGGYSLFPQPVYIEKTERNIPENYVALREGARVIAVDGDHVGNIERIITDTRTNRATHLVISSGLLSREKKLIPAHWLGDVSDDEVHLSVESTFLDRLPEFQTDH